MKSLARSARRPQDIGGSFLPPIIRPLEEAKIRLRMGTATFVAGPAGAMKTALVLYWVLRLNRPTVYFSADAEDFEIAERAAAIISGDTTDKVRAAGLPQYAQLLEQVSNVRFVYEDSPGYDDLEQELAAYTEVYGRFPEIIVIDNLLNVVGENENEWSSMRDTARVIHKLTRITKAAVLVLHHMADDRPDPTTPAPRSKLQGKVSQLPKMILSLALSGNELRVAAVKNRWGSADASGQTYATVYVDPTTNRFFSSHYDMQMGAPA